METLAVKALTGGGGGQPTDLTNLLNDFADEYSATSTYAVGDYCIYEQVLYKCNTAISTAESWTSAHWTAVNVGDEICQLNEDLADKIEVPNHPSDNKFYAMKNDEWTEFSGGGAGIDDTTTALDKTWSSSKVNAEFGSLRSKITIRCVNENSQQVSGNSVLVESVNGNYTILNTTYSGSDIELYILKETKISITLGYISGYATPSKSTFVVGNNETKTFVYNNAIIYGFHINDSESNPSDAVTYLYGATGATPAHMDFINNEFDYGSWEHAFFMPIPCMLKYDGTVDYYLDPDDYTKKVDGVTPSDVSNTEYEGNAMMEWGNGSKIWYKVVPDGDTSFSGSVYISNIQVDSEYKSWSFIDSNNNAIDHFYTPIYNGSLVSSKMRSLSGHTCMYNQTATNEVNYAKANNINASEIEWYTEVFADIQLINFLLVLMGKSLNTQDVFGYGHYTGGSSESSLLQTGTMNTKGMFWGSNSAGYGVKVFGMENWWGNQWRRYAGHLYVNNKHKYKMTYNNADGSLATSYNMDGTNYLEDATGIAGSSGGYINKEKFIAGLGMIPTSVSGTSETYYSDGCYFSNGTMYDLRGGACDFGFVVGAFASYLDVAYSDSHWNIGSAPSCKPLAR